MLFPLGRVVLRAGHHYRARLRADQLVHHGLVKHAAFAVKGDDLGLEAVRLHLGLEVLDDVIDDGADALGVLDQHRHLGRALGQVVPVLLAQLAGDGLVGFVNGGFAYLELHLRGLEMQRERGFVADGLLEGIAAEVALFILVGAEGPERVLVRPIDGRAGEAKQKRIWQRLAHLAAEIAFLGAVSFVHHDDDVRAFVQLAAGLAELVDRGDEHFPDVLPEKRLQFLPGGHADHVRNIGRIECRGDLRVEIDSIHHDDYRGVPEFGVHPQLLRGEHHKQRLAAALEMPDQPLLRVALHHPLHDLVRGEILLVPADDLDAPMLLVRGEHRETLQDVQHHLGPEHARHRPAHVRQRPFRLVLPRPPRAPDVNRHADGAIAQQLPLGGEGKDVRHEHGRHLPLVYLVDLERAVEPRHRGARGRLGLPDDDGQTVDHEHLVEPLLRRAGLVNPLVGDHELVMRRVRGVHESHGHMLAVRAEGHRLLAPQPGHEVFIGPDQTIRLHGKQNRPQGVDDLVGAVGLGRDFRVEPDERQPQPSLYHNVAGLTRNLRGRHVFPFGCRNSPPSEPPQPGGSSRKA